MNERKKENLTTILVKDQEKERKKEKNRIQ